MKTKRDRLREKKRTKRARAEVRSAVREFLALKANQGPDRTERLLAGLDNGWEGIRQAIIGLAGERGEWGGYPLPVEDAPVVLEPRHPLFSTLNGKSLVAQKPQVSLEGLPGVEFVNRFTLLPRNLEVTIFRVGGRAQHFVRVINMPTHRLDLLLTTLGCSDAWSTDAEFRALESLRGFLSDRQFRHYWLTGSFLETSKRSGVMYWFRRGRPTVALAADPGGSMRVLSCLCLHPTGYYEGTFAGSLVPSDDVLAHLLLMRGDERRFWSKANHHRSFDPQSGL